MTSGGVSSGIDLSLALVEEHLGADVARAGQGHGRVHAAAGRPVAVQGPYPHPAPRDRMLRRVLDAVAEDPSVPQTLAALARRASVGTRRLTRLFHDEMTTTRPATSSRSAWKPPRRCWRTATTPWPQWPGTCSSAPRSRCAAPSHAERRVLEHAGLVLDQLDAAVEGAVLDHLEGNVRIAVVDAFFARGPGDHREHHDPEAVDESCS